MHPRGLDHVVWDARDLEAARAQFARLGFTMTPSAKHPFGTGNSLAQFDRSFIELLSVVEPENIQPFRPGFFSFPSFNQEFLRTREGLSMIVLSSNDARADNERWAEEGLETFEVFDFARKARLPDGEEVEVAFSLAFALDPALPGLAFFVCQQHAPQHFWKPDYQVHKNGASSMSSITIVGETPAMSEAFFRRFLYDGTLEVEADRLIAQTEAGSIEVITPQAVAQRFSPDCLPQGLQGPYVAALTLAVPDLAVTEVTLKDAGQKAYVETGRITLPAAGLFGCALVFEQKSQ